MKITHSIRGRTYFSNTMALEKLDYIMLLGEGTFHQYHGGVATNVPLENHPWDRFYSEYMDIRGKTLTTIPRSPLYYGKIPPQAMHITEKSAERGLQWWQQHLSESRL